MALQKTPQSPSPALASTPVPTAVKAAAGPASGAPTSVPFWVGLTISIGWVCAVLLIIAKSGPARAFGGVPLVDWAIGISAAVSPVAMVWMVTAYLQRAADIQTIADPLRRQLTMITGESGAADARIRRFNQAIREQIELLRNAQTVSQDDLEAIMERVRQHRNDLERFESVSTHQVKDIQEVIRRSMLQVEQMMDDKFTMLRVLDGNLQRNGDGVARQVEGMRDQVARLLEEIDGVSSHMAETLDRATRDGKKLSDMSRLQESSLTGAAEAAAETLGGLSSKIDLSVAKFLERASTAREEAERLASALDAQTRALDEFSSTLPSRVSEAESVLRGVADRLYASEKMASEQAVHLSEKLSQQVDGLQGFMDRFSVRMAEVDNGLDRRHSDLNGLAERIGATTGEFLASWESSLNELNDRTGNSLLRFTVVNDETRRNADSVVAHLSETTSKYEDVVIRMRALSGDSSAQMKGMTEEIARHLAQFEQLSKASNQAGEEVQERAASALQNLQHVLERVLTAREATQAVGETLVKDIYAAVDQNEKMIQRLAETAQTGARAIVTATENLGRQESDLSAKMQAGENTLVEAAQKIKAQAESAADMLRDQTGNLKNLLAETQSQLIATDQKLQIFATQAVAPVQKAVQQVDASAEQGLRSLTAYGEGLGQQVGRLQDFHSRIGGMSVEMGKATAESASSFEALCARFMEVRDMQGESMRHTTAQFMDLSGRMEREVAGLDSQTARAVEMLQQAALKVGEQSYQMMENAKGAGAQIKDVTTALQSEAAQIQSILRKQSEEISGDLARAEQKFTSLGETIRERADAAYAAIDRAATHYGEVEQSVANAQTKVETLGTALAQQARSIDVDAAKLENHASEIAATSGRAVQNLSALNDKISVTHEAAVTYAQATVNKLEETTTLFERRTRDMAEAAVTATNAVTKAGSAFGEETGKLVDGGHQIDGVLRQLTQAAGALADQASQIRVGMEQQNNRLLSQLVDSVAQMDVTGGRLQQIVSVAAQGAGDVSTRFSDMAETASQRINATTQDLHQVAERTESTLAALGANITQQAASLSIVGEQIGEQQRILTVANENQRNQLVDLFDKLGEAHKQASDVAERSIAYLTSSLQEIHRQMGLVGDQSQEAVGNVKLASIGICDQTAALMASAQAAEQQARTVLSVTSALQEQARHLRETLQDESSRAGESLNLLLGRLASGGAELRELGTDTGAVFATLQRALGEQSGELGSAMQQISERQRNLTAALDAQRETINGLLNRLILAQDETAATAERTANRLTDGAQQITRHVETLDARAQSALLNVQAAAGAFAHEADGIETQARQAEQQSRSILAAAAGMHEQIHDLRLSMQTDGERTQAMLDSLLDKVSSGAAEMRDLGTSTEMVLTSLGNNVMQQTASLSSSMQQISDRQRSLALSLDAQRDVVNGLLNRLTLAQDETALVAERTAGRLGESMQAINQNVDVLDSRAQSALLNVQSAVLAFSTEAQAIDAQARQAETQTRAVMEAAAALQTQIGDMRTALHSEGETTTATLGNLLDRVTMGGNEIRNVGGVAETTLQTLQGELRAQTSELGSAMQAIGERQRLLTVSLEQQREVINAMLNRLTLAQDETVNATIRTVAQLSEGTTEVTRQVETLDARAQSALHNVQAAAVGFAHEAGVLETQAHQADIQARALLASASGLHEQIHDMRHAMQSEGERTSLVLDSLLEKVTCGAAEIRDASAATEMSLTSLGNKVAQQSGELTSTMQSIGEQQRGLTATLDGQRDVINGLLNRLILAQDETALVAERTAARLGEGAETLSRQIGMIDAQATDAIATVNNLSAQGQQTEQQMRGMLSITSGMQDQARQLREAMQSESANVIEQLTSVISQLDATNRQLKTESGTAVDIMEQTAQRFTAATQAGAMEIRQQADILGQIAEQSEARMSNAGEKMRGHMRLVGEMGDHAETQARQLADSAEFATARLAALRDSLATTDKDGRGLLDATSQRIDDVKAALQGELQRLSDMSQQAVAEVAGATQTLAAQSDALRANLAVSESAVAEAASLVREESSHLPGILNRNVSEIEGAVRSLKAYAAEADQSLISTADRFISVTAAARGNMIDEMQRVSDVAGDADKVLRQFNQLLAEQVAAMQQGASMLSSEQKDLVEKANASVNALSAASERLSALRGEAAITAERLAHEFDLLDQKTNTSTTRLNQASESVARQMEAMNDAATRAESKIGGASDGFRDQLERIRAGMQSQIDDINRGLMQITAQLERTGASLRSTTVGAVADVERIGQRFEQTGGIAATQLDARTEQMRKATEEVGKILTGFDEQFDGMIGRMTAAGQSINGQQGNFVSQLQNMLTHLGTVAERLEATRNMSGSVSQHAIERLDDVVNAVQAHMNNLASGAQTAAGVMRGIGQIYNDQTQGLAKGVGDAHSQVLTMNKSIDDMQQRTDRMRASLKLQGDELMNSLRQIMAQLEITGDGLSEAVDRTLQQQAADNLKKMG